MKNIILYGAGKRGRAMYAFLKSKGANAAIKNMTKFKKWMI